MRITDMTRGIDLIVFDPAGNTTIMVLTPVPRSEYADTAKRLLEIDFDEHCSWRGTAYGEQVAYIVPEDDSGRNEPIMEMCGLEFCGNASRSFAYYRVTRCLKLLEKMLVCRMVRWEIQKLAT